MGVGVLCLSLALDGLTTGDPQALLGVLFFGIGGVLVLRIVLRNAGEIILDDRGVILDTHYASGLIRWSNLREARTVIIWGGRYLGLTLADVEPYIASRQQLPELSNRRMHLYSQGFMRGMVMALRLVPLAGRLVDLLIDLFGWAPLPRSAREAELLEWNRASYGAHIIIQKMFLPQFDELLDALDARLSKRIDVPPTVPEPSPEATVGVSAPEPKPETAAYKACPMCAEQVRAEAKICRYCRYSFEEERFLPGG